MKTANPVEKDNKAHHSQSKKQRPKEPVVVPLSEVEVVSTQTQKAEDSTRKAGSVNPNTNRTNLNDNIAAVHSSQNIYGQGSEIMYDKLQESLSQTGDINHPDTQKVEKGYITTLNVDQISDYHNLKSGTYLPKTVQEQAAMAQSTKRNSETAATQIPEPIPDDAQSVQTPVAASDMSTELVLPGEQEDASVRTTPTDPHSDPQFNQTVGLVKSTAKTKRAHTTKEKAETHANAAAAVPGGERKSKARGQQVEQLDQQKSSPFKASDFKAKLAAKIKNMKLPTNEKEVDNFEAHNNIAQVNQSAGADVVASKNNVTGSIEAVSKQEPNESKVQQRIATALPDPKIGSKVNIKATVPGKRGEAELSEPITKGYKAVEQQFEKNNITDEQLANSNEPTFINTLNAKKAAKENSETAPGSFKAAESKKLEDSKQEAQSKTNSNMEGMHHSRKEMLDGVTQKQNKAGEKNTGKHQEVVSQLNKIYADTKKSVDGELNDLESKVTLLFDAGAKVAKDAFEKYVTKKTDEYKEKRYGSWYDVRGYGKRIKDAWNGRLPKEVDAFFAEGRQLFLQKLDGTINVIANLVTDRLNKAKTAITSGRQKVVTFIKNLPADVKKAIKGDIDAIQGQFKQLESSISEKESSLIDSLVTKYSNTLKEVDDMVADFKKRNQGLLSALKEATLGVWETIQNIRKTLTDLLSGAINVILSIIAHPIDFLSNLIAGVSQGFTNFGNNIWTHLKTGFFGWLTGAMKGVSITMPEDIFSLKGIFSITTQVLGLTWDGIRAIGSKVVGEPVMKVLETGFEMVQIVRKDGVAGLWEHLKDQFADLKETIMDTIMDIVQTQVIQAGIKWIMGLLTPVGAFVKAAMAIIDVVKFFIQRAAQIMELVKAFTESIKAIASGNVGAVAKSIENALGRAIPVLIGFLASLLGIGGLADKVVGVIRKIRERIVKAITKFWTFVKSKAKGLLSKIGVGGKNDKKEKKEKDKKDKKDKNYIGSESFSMSGKSHTLSFEDNEIYMESKKTKLSTKLNRGKEQVERYPASSAYNGKSELIKHQLIRLKDIQGRTEKELEKAEDSGTQTEIDKAQAKMQRLGLMIQNFGDTYQLRDIFDNDGGEHKEFQPKDVRLEAIGMHKVNVTYYYDKEAHEYGQQDFTITISLEDVSKRTVNHINQGRNLVLKKVGSRGLTIPAGKLGKYNYGLLLNSAHIIGDQFLGSGYKKGLNLILTSDEFNKQTMADAEDTLQAAIIEKMNEHKDKFVTFDLTVASTYQVLEEDPLVEALKAVHSGMTDKEKNATLLKLQRMQQLPRRCESVFYRAEMHDNLKNKLGSANTSTEHGDIWLNNLFNIQ
ncbi:hypothetical protein [Chryseobacterium viscerum]|uniref:Uncharacterized protein n=1 Tax=Chryseobacterium viscerum TaxID=1037377 RepID=A0A316WSP5_9FLAO|nr:hypothetical protein [Chryseobacterium viscerum]PWN64225.1 hypothetical protein C1634_006415 [Chryseobacterium viscerum]